MSTWTSDELGKIAAAEELELASVRRDGTVRNPVTILGRPPRRRPLRPIRQRTHVLLVPWRPGAPPRSDSGRQRLQDVLLVETDDMNDEIDAAYRTKYHRYAASIIDAIVSPQARAATIKLVPRS